MSEPVTEQKVRKLPEPQVFDYPFETKSIKIGDVEWKFRELSVEENDACSDGAKEDGIINGRTMMRLMILTSSIEPKITQERLAKMPQRLYLKICDLVNELANPDSLKDGEGDEGND